MRSQRKRRFNKDDAHQRRREEVEAAELAEHAVDGRHVDVAMEKVLGVARAFAGARSRDFALMMSLQQEMAEALVGFDAVAALSRSVIRKSETEVLFGLPDGDERGD